MIIVTERERLIELISQKQNSGYKIGTCQMNEIHCSNEELADYLLENGVVVPPVKFGDTVYKITDYYMPPWFSADDNFAVKNYICATTFKRSEIYPKNLYFTREEAEKALAERNDK